MFTKFYLLYCFCFIVIDIWNSFTPLTRIRMSKYDLTFLVSEIILPSLFCLSKILLYFIIHTKENSHHTILLIIISNKIKNTISVLVVLGLHIPVIIYYFLPTHNCFQAKVKPCILVGYC